MGDEDISGDALAQQIVRLGRSLQSRGVDVALAEIIDASRAATVIDIGSRSELYVALHSTLIKSPLHTATFDAAFDRLFPARRASTSDPSSMSGSADRSAQRQKSAPSKLATGDDLIGLAMDLVDEHGGLDAEQRGERHHMHRVYRAADLARLMTEAQQLDPNLSTSEVRARLDELKRLIAADIRGRLGDNVDRDNAEVAGIEDIDFLHATRDELDRIRPAIKPLARKLAARVARRRHRRSSGRINLRKTTRRALSSGGVPIDLALDRPRAHRPELVVLCDISGSVAEFSMFTLSLMSALSAEVTETRLFVFIDAVDEITQLLSEPDHGIGPWQIMRNTNVIGIDGHSDYGSVLEQWWSDVGRHELRRTATVIIAGDARNNHRPTRADVLGEVASRARRLYWFNPEPRAEWDTEDSVMAEYAQHCDEVFEVRDLRDLADCVERIL